MTVGFASARTLLMLIVLALVPLLLAITIDFPARAGSPDERDVATVEEVVLPAEQAVPPAGEIPGEEFEVILDTGVVTVGHESKISAIAITATPDD